MEFSQLSWDCRTVLKFTIILEHFKDFLFQVGLKAKAEVLNIANKCKNMPQLILLLLFW